MPKVKPSFFDRIKTQVSQRVRQELAPGAFDGSQELAPDEQLDSSFLGRIKKTVTDKLRGLSFVQRRMLDPQSPLDDATIRFRIHYAGMNHLLLLMRYNNQWRHVEPYSYRARGKPSAPGGKPVLLFYGYCRIHDEIHAFRPDKIQGLIVTDQVFQPRWPIEVA
jgi:hypothetical protein